MCLWLHALAVIRLPALTVTLTYALIQMVKKIAGKSDKARMITKARVTELIMSGGACLMNVWISARRNGCGGAWPFLVGGVNRLVNFVDDRDLCLLYCVKYDSYLITGFVVQSAHFQKLPLPVLFFRRSFSIR